MNVLARLATSADADWCQSRDHLVSGDVVRRKILQHELVVAAVGDDLGGYLRLGFLWSTHPLIELIWVEQEHRRIGLGRALLEFVEHMLREQGHKILLSSSQADEPASQAWHRTVGFRECGFIAEVNDHGVGEVLFSKRIA